MFKKTFKGGVHPDDGKRYAKDASYRTYLPQGELVFPMSQHIGKPAKPVVKKGDMVLAGQLRRRSGRLRIGEHRQLLFRNGKGC